MFIFSSRPHAGSRAAMRVMGQQQPRGGKIFLVDGQGSDGRPTPKNAAYGASKAALVQLKVAEPMTSVALCCAALWWPATAAVVLAATASGSSTDIGVGGWLLSPGNAVPTADPACISGVPRGASAWQRHLCAPGVPRHGGDRPAGRKRQVPWLPVSMRVCAFVVVPEACLATAMQSHVGCHHDHAGSS